MKDVLRYYISDGKTIYYHASALKGVDAATFRFVEISETSFDNIGVDKNGMISESSRWTEQDLKTIKSNILDAKGNIINRDEENMNWVKAYNRVATEGMRISTGEK